MTRDDFVPSIGSDLELYVGCCCGTVLFVSMESSVFVLEQSWLQFVVAMGIASCIGLVHGKLCIG